MKEKAVEYFKNGYSCSEAIIQSAIDEGLCPKDFLPAATAFSGGMSSGSTCGAITAIQMLNGYHFGRDNKNNNSVCARENAAYIVEKFKENFKNLNCSELSGNLQGMERKEHCSRYVYRAGEIMEKLLNI